jgi:predicted kinase
VMNRFPEEAELTHIARHTGIDDDLAERLGQSAARYHDAAPVRDLDGTILIEEILDELDRVFAPMTAFGADARAFLDASRQALEGNRATMTARSRTGHVRRCHGDLHLRNIVMLGDVPTPFDALEFDERLGTCDTLYDLAFLLMDLDHLGMRRAANTVLNAYLAGNVLGAEDYGLNLLPLYLSVRAAIRAMVDIQSAGYATDPAKLTSDARSYMRQALGYLSPAPPKLVAIGGYSGTGKTTVARAIAHHIGAAPGAILVRSDVVRKALMDCDPLTKLGPEGYAPEVTGKTYAMMRTQTGHVLQQGHSAILDAVHGTSNERRAAENIAASEGTEFFGIWLDAATPIRAARVASRGPDASDADVDVVHSQAGKDPGAIHWHHINADQTIGAVLADVTDILRTDRDQRAR